MRKEIEECFKNLPKFKGYKYTGEYRLPKKGEFYLDSYCTLSVAQSDHVYGHNAILVKK